MAERKVDKAKVVDLLRDTDRGYRDIASEVGCSRQRIGQLALQMKIDTREREVRSRKRAGQARLAIGKHGVNCPRCDSEHVVGYGKSKRYGTPRYQCAGCGRKFMVEYRWITSGDRDRHLREICSSSGYTRSDGFERWQRMRGRVWPYLQGEYSDADALLKVVNDAIPRTVPEHIRADVCQDALVALLECEVEQSAITLKPFLSRWFRKNVIGYRPLSLDQPSRYREGESLGQEMGLY